MSQEGVSIHWHGMDQRHTPWMDGVASITQCPINPQETFTYIFVASPVGTAWYHSHYGAQYADGLFGPLIVLPRPQDVLSAATLEDKSGQEKNIQGGARTERPDQDQDLPHFAEEFVLMVSDWFQEESSSLMNRQVETLMKFGEDYTDMDNCFVKTITEDGSEVGSIKFESGLFNGRGRYDATSKVPLERFVVERGRFYRFRVISTATVYPFRLSIDKHKLMIFATEGGPITPVEADYLFIHSGERYDFYIRADQSGDLFWFRGEAPEKYYQVALPLSAPGKQVTQPGMVAAVLQYQEDGREGASSAGMGPRGGAPSQKENGVGVSPKRGNQSGSTASTVTEAGSSGTAGAKDTSAPVRQDYPTTNPRKCTKARPCTAVNCPFQNYATSHISCVNVGDLSGYTSPEGAVKPGVKTPRQGATDVIQEKIINFHFAFGHGGKGAQRSSVNGHEFILPSSPPVVNPFAQWDYPCTGICDDQQCMCTYTEQLNLGSTVQLVLFNSLSDLPPTNSISTGVDAIGHPVHLHGHKFTVLKVGYPTYDNLTGIIEAVNPDLRCPTDRCERPEWADPSWAGGRVPGLNLDNPVVKDTVIVPAAGYVVVRFEADNPGWWLLHCHLLIHAADGMSMLLQEGHVADMPKIPPGLPWCGSWSPSQINRTVNQMRLRAASDQSQAGAVVAAIVLVVILVTVSGISIVIKCRKKEEKTIKGPSYGGLSSHTSSMSFDHSSSMSLDLSSSVTCPTATTRP